MKIHNTDPQQPIQRIAADRVGKPAERKTATPHEAASAVHVSDTSRKLAAAKAPEVPDQARIERLKGLLASGKLHIDAGAIADAMLREEK